MANTRYIKALDKFIESFKSDFIDYSRSQFTDEEGDLIHAGEFGRAREAISKQLFENTLPKLRKIELNGFIINAKNEISTEQDLVFYSEVDTPLLTFENIKLFPVETVVAVGQIKSIIRTKPDLKDALVKLSKVKMMRENMGHNSLVWRSPEIVDTKYNYSKERSWDQVTTFIICEEINFNITPEEIDKLYPIGTPPHLKHNLILDLQNGAYGYQINSSSLVGIPLCPQGIGRPVIIHATEDNRHIKNFLANIQILIPGSTIYHPDMGTYLTENLPPHDFF